MKVKSLSCVWFFATPWTAAYQAPPSMGFSRQEYWSGLTLPFRDIRVKKLECTWLVRYCISLHFSHPCFCLLVQPKLKCFVLLMTFLFQFCLEIALPFSFKPSPGYVRLLVIKHFMVQRKLKSHLLQSVARFSWNASQRGHLASTAKLNILANEIEGSMPITNGRNLKRILGPFSLLPGNQPVLQWQFTQDNISFNISGNKRKEEEGTGSYNDTLEGCCGLFELVGPLIYSKHKPWSHLVFWAIRKNSFLAYSRKVVSKKKSKDPKSKSVILKLEPNLEYHREML